MRFVIIGGGPAGNQAATYAARLGAEVVLVERDIVGGAAHLWDCIPSKTMIATGGAMSFFRRAEGMGLDVDAALDRDSLRARVERIEARLHKSVVDLLTSQNVRIIEGTARLKGPNQVVVDTASGVEELEADAIQLSTGSRPRVPEWCTPDGTHVLTTRDCYPPPQIPEHAVVVGSGVTGVEFVHMLSSLGSKVSLIVSRQQVLPTKDPEVAAALEADFLARGVMLLKGARAVGIDVDGGVTVRCDDGRRVEGSHAILAIGSVPNVEGLGLEAAGVETDDAGYVRINHHCQSNVPHIYAAGDLSGKAAALLCRRDARTQDRRARDGVAHPGAPPSRLRQGCFRDLHRARDRRCGPGRGRGVR